MLASSGARPTMHRVKDRWTELFILSLSLCCSMGQVTIGFSDTTIETINEGAAVTKDVCRDFADRTTNVVLFLLTASQNSGQDVILPSGSSFIPAGMRCVTVGISALDDSMREDTESFQISLSLPFGSTVDIDANQNQFILYIEDNDGTGTTGTFNFCPLRTTAIMGTIVSCPFHNAVAMSVCTYQCMNGYKVVAGLLTRTCIPDLFRWTGNPPVCAPNDTPSTPVIINNCPTSILTHTVSRNVNLPAFFNAPVPTTTGISTRSVTGVPFNNRFPEGSTFITYTFTNDAGRQAVCTFTIMIDVDYCDPRPNSCQPGTTCVEGSPFPSQITCVDINECSSSPCQNGGQCVDQVNGYGCTCAAGFAGTNCAIDINECSSSPCRNGGQCVDQVNGYGCTCAAGFAGTNCAIDLDECNSSPCKNGGQCVNLLNRYRCICTAGYTGTNCVTDINECSSSPCRNGGHCVNQVNGYRCFCAAGFVGTNCAIDDITSPAVLFCPSNKFQTVQFGIQSAIVTWNEPTARDDSMSVSVKTQSHMSGSNFNVGTTTVRYIFSDPAGNTAECAFNVSVVQDCTILQATFCTNPGVSCNCVDELCDAGTGICSSSCTIVDDCPATIESKSLTRVNPSSSVNITCTLKGSTTILERLRLRLSSKSDDLVDELGITALTGNGVNTGDKVEFTFRVDNVTKEKTLYCILHQGNYLIGKVSVTNFVHELPVLNSAPIKEDISNTSITIIWRAWNKPMDNGNPPIVAYIPYYKRNTSDVWMGGPRILSNETLQFTADNLEVDTLYEFSVAAVREGKNGEGRRSQVVSLKTHCNVPEEPVSVNVQITSSNRVNVSWQLPPGEVMCSTGVTSFKVYYRIEGSTDDTPQLAGTVEDAGTTSLIIDDGLLEPGTSYIFFVTVTTDQESGFSVSKAFDAPASGSLIAIIGAVIGIAVLLILLLLVILVLIKRKKDKQPDDGTPAPKPVDNTYDNPVFGIPLADGHTQGAVEPAKPAGPELKMQTSVREDYENKSVENLNVENESPSDDVIYGNLEQPKPIRVAEFGEYFRQNVDKFDHEFSILEGSTQLFDWMAAEDPANKKKNRFKNMYTYDHSRVVLRELPDQEGSDYYNASFIKDTNDVVSYIASQAPNRASLEAFVRMIWEQHVTTIVMVANLYEDGKERCLQYWPENEGGSTSFGFVTVTWSKTTQFSDYVIRYFTFNRGRETREVQQLHFLTWPDKDTPEHGTALIEFTKQSKLLHRGKKYPMLVHCSAGIGRTGTFICLSCMMDVLRDDEYIDVFGFVNKMRQNRINMVQTSKQYVFLYKCLNEYHLTYQTEMSIREMTRLDVESQRGIFLGEFELLSELGHTHRKDTVKNCLGKKKENIARNRVRNMVPSNRNRVFLMSPGQSNEENYINASYVKSFQTKDAFVTTQSPLPNTIEDFWRMVYDVKSPLIVMLNQLDPADKTCIQYWPDRGSSEYGNMYVTCVATERQSDYTQRTFEVKHVNSKEVLSVTHLQLEEWRPDINLQGIVGLIKDVDMMQKRGQYTRSIVIHCINGFERSGVMVTVKSELERIAVTERIDVFSTVKKLRDQHEHMLKNKDDYILCYHLLKAYLANSNSNYENSEDLRRGGVM